MYIPDYSYAINRRLSCGILVRGKIFLTTIPKYSIICIEDNIIYKGDNPYVNSGGYSSPLFN